MGAKLQLTLFFQGILLLPTLLFLLFLLLLIVSALSGGLDTAQSDGAEGLLSDFTASLGLSKIPLVVGLSTTFFIMMCLSYFLTILGYSAIHTWIDTVSASYLQNVLHFLIDFLTTTLTFIVSLFIAGFVLKPLEKRIFHSGHSVNYIGQTATVRYVFEDSHQARIVVLINGYESTLKGFSQIETFEVGQTVTIMAKDTVLGSYLITKNRYNSPSVS